MKRVYDFSLPESSLDWQDGVPISKRYGDYYFSSDDGIEEVKHVFIKPNNLVHRWNKPRSIRPFTIVETGFGTGLNFLSIVDAWAKTPEPKLDLHFLSIEQEPLSIENMGKAHKQWPQFSSYSSQLLEQYPNRVRGKHEISLCDNRVTLSLIYGNIHPELANYSFSSDCWFLDGFSPAKNPDMWRSSLFKLMAQRSNTNATFSTFTSASKIRKGLEEEGFEVLKLSGYGKKREFLSGKILSQDKRKIHYYPAPLPLWACSRANAEQSDKIKPIKTGATEVVSRNINHRNINKNYDVAIIGAGIAGLTTANKLAEKGMRCLVIDKRSKMVDAASGQEKLAMYVKFPATQNKEAKLILQCLTYSQHYFDNAQSKSKLEFWNKTGLLQLAWNNKERTRQLNFNHNYNLPDDIIRAVNVEQASKLTGLDTQQFGQWFANCGILEPPLFAEATIARHKLDVKLNTLVTGYQFCEHKKQWLLTTNNDEITAKYLVVASAHEAKQSELLKHLPLKPIRGQVSSVFIPNLKGPKSAVCGEGYLCPSTSGWHHFGATFELNDTNEEPTFESHMKNIENLTNWLPNWANDAKLRQAKSSSSAGLRCTTPDYNPIVGLAPNFEIMKNRFSKLREDSNACKDIYGNFHPQLFVNVGHGSKGLITTPICAEVIAAEICQSPSPLDSELQQMLSPARFIIKHLAQRRI